MTFEQSTFSVLKKTLHYRDMGGVIIRIVTNKPLKCAKILSQSMPCKPLSQMETYSTVSDDLRCYYQTFVSFK